MMFSHSNGSQTFINILMPIKDSSLDDRIRMPSLVSLHMKVVKSLTGQGTKSHCNITALHG